MQIEFPSHNKIKCNAGHIKKVKNYAFFHRHKLLLLKNK